MVHRLGSYLLVERLNQGGMADVYLAKSFGFSGADQILAVKCIRHEISEDRVFVRMFVDEAKLSVLLDHANIAQTYELGRIDGTYFIAMEFVQGRDLRAVIDRARARGLDLPAPIVLQIMGDICDGLDYAHRKTDPTGVPLNIVHRDVSPQNVLASYDGRVKLIDFGIAKAATQASRSQAGVLKGKYGYMSPEQVRGLAVDHRSDIFAAGVVFWELATRERLFSGSSDFSVLDKVRNAEIYPPALVAPALHPDIERVILCALSRDPAERYASASDMHDAIVEVMLRLYGPPNPRELAALMQALFAADVQEDQRRVDKARRYTEMPAEALPLRSDDGAPEAAATHDDPHEGTEPAAQLPAVPEPAAGGAATTARSISGDEQTMPEAGRKPVAASARRESTRVDPREPVAVPVSAFIQQSPPPTEVREAAPGKRRKLRELVIVAAALAFASLLVSITWVATRPSAQVQAGSLVLLSSPPAAKVLIDGVEVGVTPFSSFSVAEGRHTVTLRKSGFSSVSRSVRVVSAKVVELEITLEPGGPP